jgi:hypothetical protein
MSLISNAPIIIPKSGDSAAKKDFLTSLTGKRFLYETRVSPRSGAPRYFSISQEPVSDLNFNRLTGKLSGTVSQSGVYVYRITASNEYGSDYVDIELAVRKRGFTNDNYLAELTEDPALQRKAWENLSVDPDMLPVLQQISEDPDPWIRNDFACMNGYARNIVNPSQIDVQFEIDAANNQAEAIQSVTGLKLSEDTLPETNVTAEGSFVATQFWRGEAELAPSLSNDFIGTSETSPSWNLIDGPKGDADKIELSPPAPRNTILIEGSLTVRNGITVANEYFENTTGTFRTIQETCEASPTAKIQHFDIQIGDTVLKLPVYVPAIPGL